MPLSPGDILVLATSNEGKIKEFKDLLKPYNLKILTLKKLGLSEAEETGITFKENAILKATACAKASGLYALADDSGLSVKALGGRPGVFTAQWAGIPRNYNHAMKKINDELTRLKGHPDRRASFICVLALSSPAEKVEVFEGEVKGHLIWPTRGQGNMGFDPIFIPEGSQKTFGEMTPLEKQKFSHRAQAFLKLSPLLKR